MKGLILFISITTSIFHTSSSFAESAAKTEKWMGGMASFCNANYNSYNDKTDWEEEIQKFSNYDFDPSKKVPSPPSNNYYALCICKLAQHLKRGGRNTNLDEYCVAFTGYDVGVGFGIVLSGLDVAAAGACTTACAASFGTNSWVSPAANACNCAAAVDMGVDALHQWVQLAETQSYLSDSEPRSLSVLFGPVMTSVGAVMSKSSCKFKSPGI